MSVNILRLVNNEEVIGEIEYNEENGTYTVNDGAVIIPAGEGRMALIPWLPHAKNSTVTINEDRVVLFFEPITELANEYSARHGNGLVVPSGTGNGTPEIPNLRMSDY